MAKTTKARRSKRVQRAAPQSRRYSWAVRFGIKAKPEAAAAEFDRIRKTRGGLSRALLLEESTPPHSALHDEFLWDDTRAAHEYRLDQAGRLIGALKVVLLSEDGEPASSDVRAYCSIGEQDEERDYEPTLTIMASGAKRERLLEIARAELKRWQERYDGFAELARVYEAIESVAV